MGAGCWGTPWRYFLLLPGDRHASNTLYFFWGDCTYCSEPITNPYRWQAQKPEVVLGIEYTLCRWELPLNFRS